MIYFYILLWVYCGVLAYGISLYDVQNLLKDYHYWQSLSFSDDRKVAIFLFCLGAAGLLIALIISDRPYGLMFRRPKDPRRAQF